jgi:hypothetical protein
MVSSGLGIVGVLQEDGFSGGPIGTGIDAGTGSSKGRITGRLAVPRGARVRDR